MAFSFRKIISNINYFKKPDDDSFDVPNDDSSKKRRHASGSAAEETAEINFERLEPDSTSKQCTSLNFPESMKNFAAKKGSLSDTDLLMINIEGGKKEKRRSKKLRLDIKKANQSVDNIDQSGQGDNVENTPKHILLECKSSEAFSERFKKLDFNRSFDLFDAMSDVSSDQDMDIESLTDSDSDISIASNEKSSIKMCRKVDGEPEINEHNQLVPSATPESFGDVEIDRNEEERIALLLNYQMKFEKMECLLKNLLSQFQFHVEVSKIFHCRSFVTTLPGTDVTNIPKILGEVTYLDTARGVSPTDSWNIIMEKEDIESKNKVKKLLLSIKNTIDQFVNVNLKSQESKPKLNQIRRSITYDLHKGTRTQKKARMNNKKKLKHFDFPDFRDAMIALFEPEDVSNYTSLDVDESDFKCICKCHHNESTDTDSGLTSKSNDRSMSITSSIGNFTLDSSTLTAFSESLDLIISYNSFQDTSLFSTLLQKAAIERITFYVQVHSIQLKCETSDDFESKNVITFHCPSCKTTENEENGVLKHIFSQTHCEKIHFQYKTAYIKKCVQSGKEIQPSTVLNPMTMYRDDNKIVCFGDAMYACSLCFENLIVGESVLMAHCSEADHVERREKLCEIFD